MRLRLSLVLFVALTMALGMGACADELELCTESYTWDVVNDFDTSGSTCVYKVHNPLYSQPEFFWDYKADEPCGSYVQGGQVPEADPLVNQVFRNRTTAVWTDWHISITGGYIVWAQVYNDTLPVPQWYLHDYVANMDGYTEMSFYTVSGSETYVGQLGVLHVTFEYMAYEDLNVQISQYPTTYAPIPEPTSIIALVTGLVGLVGLKRRAR